MGIYHHHYRSGNIVTFNKLHTHCITSDNSLPRAIVCETALFNNSALCLTLLLLPSFSIYTRCTQIFRWIQIQIIIKKNRVLPNHFTISLWAAAHRTWQHTHRKKCGFPIKAQHILLAQAHDTFTTDTQTKKERTMNAMNRLAGPSISYAHARTFRAHSLSKLKSNLIFIAEHRT